MNITPILYFKLILFFGRRSLNTGFYFTFIGVSQVVITIQYFIPAIALIGAITDLTIIVNICVLIYAVRFEDKCATTFMLLANLFLLVWYYDRQKSLLPRQ